MPSKRVIDSLRWKLYVSPDLTDEIEKSLRCPRCGAQMESVGGGAGCIGLSVDFVVPPITVLKCPQCGYEERSWDYPGY